MEKLLELEIVTPQQQVFQGKVLSVSVPGELAPFQILYNHAPIVSALENGVIFVITPDEKTHRFAVSSGFLSAAENKVSVFVEKALSPSELNRTEIEQKLNYLKKKLNEPLSEHQKKEIKQQIKDLNIQLKVLV
ncbi:MAG: ATP synthase F1 subunit epsilon [Ignavibacteria bacterium]|nr:ATP synthase F1 subunit epsilon [Ignavibacteria bacterium]